VEKYFRAGQATCDNVIYAHLMPDTEGYKYMLRICITYCFSHCSSGYMSARQWCVICALSVIYLVAPNIW
jgi:hypothetical protein